MKINIISIDIEDWYLSYDSSQIDHRKWHLMEDRISIGLERFLSLLSRHDQKATFFIMGWVAERSPDIIREIVSKGHEIGYHSYFHELPASQGIANFEKDLADGLRLLESITGKRPEYYRAPMFSLDNGTAWVIPLLIKHGIRASSSFRSYVDLNGRMVPSTPFLFSLGDTQLMEFPLNLIRFPLVNWVYSGSGYFRVLPGKVLDKLFRSQEYNLAYFHPRDFDTDVPETDLLPIYRNWMNRIGNRTTMSKLDQLLTKYPFMSVGEAVEVLGKERLVRVEVG